MDLRAHTVSCRGQTGASISSGTHGPRGHLSPQHGHPGRSRGLRRASHEGKSDGSYCPMMHRKSPAPVAALALKGALKASTSPSAQGRDPGPPGLSHLSRAAWALTSRDNSRSDMDHCCCLGTEAQTGLCRGQLHSEELLYTWPACSSIFFPPQY